MMTLCVITMLYHLSVLGSQHFFCSRLSEISGGVLLLHTKSGSVFGVEHHGQLQAVCIHSQPLPSFLSLEYRTLGMIMWTRPGTRMLCAVIFIMLMCLYTYLGPEQQVLAVQKNEG